ncbi:class I SAM-dependent methyltransferase [Candidatus Leptofilum sp.]|uniref:class I SAM-dependent methyltransferase n=1 Tax=Candidatus Leptofilum sp. TaxID=3241576 RepID=UPI003B5B4A5A
MSIRIDPEEREFEALLALAGDLTGQRVLEVGCGNGRITTHLAPHAAHITAIDPDAKRIATAKANLPPELAHKISYRTLALEELPPDEKYDMVLLSWSL